MDIEFLPADVSQKNIKKLISFIENDDNFLGGSIALPYKEIIQKYLKNNSFASQLIGSSNVLFKNKNNELSSDNTDGEALVNILIDKIEKIKEKKILVIGFGGTGKSICVNFLLNEFNFVAWNRDIEKIIDFNINNKSYQIEYIDNLFKNINKYDVIINATSSGHISNFSDYLFNEDLLSKINKSTYVVDVIYQPLRTKLLEYCALNQIRFMNGLEMNLMQAVLAFKKVIFYPQIDNSKIRQIMFEV